MKECKKCAIQYEDYFTFCRKCGGPLLAKKDVARESNIENDARPDEDSRAPQSSTTRGGAATKDCPSCGTPNLPDANFCKKCKQTLHKTAPDNKAPGSLGQNSSGPDGDESTIEGPTSREEISSATERASEAAHDVQSPAPPPREPHVLRNIIVGASIAACIAIVGYITLSKEKAQISISTKPSGASVTIDGENKGQTPKTDISVNSGSHRIVLEKQGYSITEQDISVKSGEKKSLTVTLKRKLPSTDRSSGQTAISGPDKTPPSANPAIPNTVGPEIVGFIERYFRDTESRNINLVLSHYGEEVDYFSKGVVKKDFIKKDKEQYFKRWTIILNALEGEPEVQNTLQENMRTVRFGSRFSVRNEKQSISGRVDNTWTLRRTNDGWKIVAEQQNVLSRDKN